MIRVDPANGNRTVLSDDNTVHIGFGSAREVAVEADDNLVVVDFSLDAVVCVNPASGDRTILSNTRACVFLSIVV